MTGENRIVFDEDDAVYRAAPGNNYSAIKHMLDCPARYRYETTHRTERKEFDFGHLVHGIVLGRGDPVEIIDARDWRSKDAQVARRTARDEGRIPCLPHEWARAQACAQEILDHPQTGPFFKAEGRAEVSIYWTDADTGLACKGRIDWLVVTSGMHILDDVKTIGTTSDPKVFGRHAAKYEYPLQAAFYIDGYAAAAGVDPFDVMWLNTVAESEPPHLPALVELDERTIAAGRSRYKRALARIVECTESGEWPGYTMTEAALVSAPTYYIEQELDQDE